MTLHVNRLLCKHYFLWKIRNKNRLSSALRIFLGALTLQHLKQIWSRRLFKHINKNLKLLKTLRYISHIILKTLWPKEILLSLSNISFGHNVFKSRLLQWRLYASPGDEELRVNVKNCDLAQLKRKSGTINFKSKKKQKNWDCAVILGIVIWKPGEAVQWYLFTYG